MSLEEMIENLKIFHNLIERGDLLFLNGNARFAI